MVFNKSILREADIRGIYPNEVNGKFAYRLGQVFGTFIIKNKHHYCVVGHDNRFGGPDLTKNLIEGLISTGVDVDYIGLVTTPMLNYASRKLGQEYGAMVTASHNPRNDNGFKLFGKDYMHCNHDELKVIYDNLCDDKFHPSKGDGSINHIDIDGSYVKYVAGLTNPGNRHMNVVIDPGNGTTATIIKRIYDRLPYNVKYINADSNPNFPFHHPDPNVKANLVDLCKEVKRMNADIGIAYDGDGDRVGVVDNKGRVIDMDVMMAIMAPIIIKNNPEKPILLDVKCSNVLKDVIMDVGGKYLEDTPSSARQEDIMFYNDLDFGGGYSNHVFFGDRHPGYDDGIYAGLRFQEMLSHTNKHLSDMTKHLPKYFNTDEIKIKTTDDKKWDIVNGVKEYADLHKYKYMTTDGIKVIKENSWALVRASNTGPNLTLRFEAKSKRGLTMIQNEFMDVIGIISK